MEKLAIGEQYLSVNILGGINVAVFKNKNKTQPNQPDYVGNGVSIWVRKKQPPKQFNPEQVQQQVQSQPITETEPVL